MRLRALTKWAFRVSTADAANYSCKDLCSVFLDNLFFFPSPLLPPQNTEAGPQYLFVMPQEFFLLFTFSLNWKLQQSVRHSLIKRSCEVNPVDDKVYRSSVDDLHTSGFGSVSICFQKPFSWVFCHHKRILLLHCLVGIQSHSNTFLFFLFFFLFA